MLNLTQLLRRDPPPTPAGRLVRPLDAAEAPGIAAGPTFRCPTCGGLYGADGYTWYRRGKRMVRQTYCRGCRSAVEAKRQRDATIARREARS